MPIYAARGSDHRAQRRKIAKAIKKNTTRLQRRQLAKSEQVSKRKQGTLSQLRKAGVRVVFSKDRSWRKF